MPQPSLTDDDLLKTLAYNSQLGPAAAARELGIPENTFRSRLRRARQKFAEFETDDHPDPDADIDDIIARRKAEFARGQAAAAADKQITIRLKDSKPFGLCVFGDTHWDNPGTNLELYESHAASVLATEGMYAGHIGDCLDNWVGRLEPLYAGHTITPSEGWLLAEHYLRQIAPKLLFLSGGNHDGWSKHRDPLRYILRDTKTIYRNHRTRLRICHHKTELMTIHARHLFKGNSLYNNAHAALRELLLGHRDDVAICGHYHKSGISVTKDPDTGRKMSAVLVAAYKQHDDYAAEKGFPDQNLSPACALVVDTRLDRAHPDRVQLFWDPLEAADVLAWRRKA